MGDNETTAEAHDFQSVVEKSQRDPVWWVRKILGCEPWEKQCDILNAIRDHKRVAVRSCHGIGKSYIAARAALWFLYTHPYSIVATTAPTGRQVREILWQEIRRAFNSSPNYLGAEILQTKLSITDGWFAFGFSTDDSNAFQGLHADHLLVIIDEAAGVHKDIWTAAEGVMSSEHCRLLAIGNPTENSGPFYDEFKSPGTFKIAVPASETPNLQTPNGEIVIPGLVTREWVEDKKKRWGETSPMYRSRVNAEFPEASSDTLISLSLIEAAQRRELTPGKPEELGVDVARFGDDETVIMHRAGPVARIVSAQHKEDTMETSGRVIEAMRKTKAKRAKVDVVGIGAGVVDRLRELKIHTEEASAGEVSNDPERFVNKRAEWFWGLRERFVSGDIDIDPLDDELVAQLSSIKYKIDSRGRIALESKDDMKKRGLGSPDRADALAIAFAETNDGAAVLEKMVRM